VPNPIERLQAGLAERYRVERELGQGGMAVVYLATDLRHGREVAIKLLQPELAAVIGPARFLREIEIAARLQHPHILPVYDSGEVSGLLYYVMPYVAGESVQQRISRGGALPVEDAVQIAREVASALDYAHRQGIVHRDIKPANILLSQGHAQVADFGIARALSASGSPALTQAGMAIGTPAYMSPEQALGQQDVDARSDVYALGCVLFEMLTGRAPYAGTTPQSIVAQSISAPVPQLQGDTRGFQALIDRAMAKEPGARFHTAGEMEAALRAPAAVRGVRHRRRATLIAGAAAVAAIVAAVVLWPRGYRVEGDPRRSLVIFPFDNRTGDPSRDYLQDASFNLLGLAVSHWEDLRVFDDERTASLLRRRGVTSPGELDFALAQDLAQQAHVGTMVLGDLRLQGDTLVVEAKVHDVRSGDRIATEIVRAAAGADPRPLFDSLAARILRVSGAPAGERPELAAQTTRSLEAYRAYLQGMEALQQLRVDSARAALQRAIALDSTFALAYLRLRDADGWIGLESNPEQRREWVARAETFSGSLPPRLRSLVQFHAAYQSGELGRARGIVSQLIARDSSDAEAWYQLGEVHFHDRALATPHPDSAGNLGLALGAFRRALAIEPRYVLAYQHIFDALSGCAAGQAWVCLPDSAVYAPPESLARRYGAARIASIRQTAEAARLETATAWVAAAPRSDRARSHLLRLLLEDERYGEAQTQTAALRASGDSTTARMWDALRLVREQDYADAADSMVVALADTRQVLRQFTVGIGWDQIAGPLFAGGRDEAAGQWLDAVLQVFTTLPDRVSGPGNVQIPSQTLGMLLQGARAAAFGIDTAAQQQFATRWLDTIDSLFADDSSSRERATAGSMSGLLSVYAGTGDTVLLRRVLDVVDTTSSRSWRAIDAHLALARGDTARALRRYAEVGPDSGEYAGGAGIARTVAWASVMAHVGRYREAIDLLGRLDSTAARLASPSSHVRSFAERGALYQRIGDTTHAIDMYERFITAWERGDDIVQPAVRRAREAVAALRGEPPPLERP